LFPKAIRPPGAKRFFCVQPALQRRICFSQTNLLDIEHLPTLPMDVIFCQNVLVYFRRWRVKQVLDALVERLKPGGLLVLGPGEAAHWQHPALVRTTHQGVTAWLRRIEQAAGNANTTYKNSSGSAGLESSHAVPTANKVESHGH
jgi:chemotaxis protein methyltransferase CheR/type IV pilus assembly protein PilK